jgi:hypothetical protein
MWLDLSAADPVETRVADPHHFNADPDPVFHFNVDPDPDLVIEVIWICFHYFEDSLSLGSILGLHASIVSFSGPQRLYFELVKLLNFDFNSDMDPSFYANTDPDLGSKNNPDPEPGQKQDLVSGGGLQEPGLWARVLPPLQRTKPHPTQVRNVLLISQSIYIYRVPQCMSPRRNWDSPTSDGQTP